MRLRMTMAAALTLGATAMAQDAPRRLESVTWNSVKHELTWVISSGERKDEGYKALKQQSYLINMDAATMTFGTETRRFSGEEAVRVRGLMDLVSKYAVESTIWWDDGQGEKLDGSESGPGTRVALPRKTPVLLGTLLTSR